MKIYLASRYSMRDKLRLHADFLNSIGHTVTSSWIYTNWRTDAGGASAAPPEHREEWAMRDLRDVELAECLVYFATGERARGGCHIEFGYALRALFSTLSVQHVCVIGEPENLFHYHPIVKRFKTWDEFLQWLMGDQ